MNESITRAISGIVYIILLIAATLYSKESFIGLFGIFMVLAVIEFCNLIHLNKIIAVFLSLIALLTVIYFKFSLILYLNIVAFIVACYLIIKLFSKKNPILRSNIQKYVLLIGYIIIPFILLIVLPFLSDSENFNPKIIIGIFVIIWINDTFAYITGKTMGKKKLFERISPKKTIEGFFGGLVFAILGSYILSHFYTFLSPISWIITGVIVALFGTIGDLVESFFKRNANVKDSGKIMPGHGGILDRLDSIIFAIPFLFLFYQILSYVS